MKKLPQATSQTLEHQVLLRSPVGFPVLNRYRVLNLVVRHGVAAGFGYVKRAFDGYCFWKRKVSVL